MKHTYQAASLLLILAAAGHAQGPGTGINLNHATPAAPIGTRNVVFQNDSSAPSRNISAYVTFPTMQVACPSGSDLSTAVNACLASLPSTIGGICDARACSNNYTWNNPTTFSNPNEALLLPCGTLTATATISVTPTVRNTTIHGCAYQGGSASSGTAGGTVWNYQGSGAAFVVGDPADGSDTPGFFMTDLTLATANGGSSARAIDFHRTQEIDVERVYFIGNNGTGQTGITLDGTGNYSGGTFQSFRLSNFGTALLMTGDGTGGANASTFTRMHLNCPTSGGAPITGGVGINLAYGDGNTFVGGDIEGCDTMLTLGAGAVDNTFNGVRNENSNSQVIAASGSQYNLWLAGGTMFTGRLTDAGTHNSFVDTFHRSWNNLRGDLWRSQSDETITDHVYTGIGLGDVRGRIQEWQTDVPGSPGNYQAVWQWGPGDGSTGTQVWALGDLLNHLPRFAASQLTSGAGTNQTILNATGTGQICLNCSTGAGTGGLIVSSGGLSPTTAFSVNGAGNGYFAGTLETTSNATFAGSTLVRNQADAEIDSYLQSGLTTEYKESFTYRDHTGASQWYMVRNTSGDWALNSAPGTLDSFKAYQSTNSGDTYVNAQKATGVVRVNYEPGSGTAFVVYGGNSTTQYMVMTGSTYIKFPGFATGAGYNCLQIDGSGFISNTGTACGTGSGSGSVTSVGLALPAEFNVTGSPVTGSGTLTGAWAVESPHTFFAGPASGGSAAPGFRTIVANDVPTLNQSTTGNAATATGPQTVPNPCTGGEFSYGTGSGFAPDCGTVTYADLGGTVPTWNQSTTGNAATASALASSPTQCPAGQYATGVNTAGNATCSVPLATATWSTGASSLCTSSTCYMGTGYTGGNQHKGGYIMQRAGTVQNCSAAVGYAVTSSSYYTATLLKNGSACSSGPVIVINNGAYTVVTDSTHTCTVAAGDQMTWQMTVTGSGITGDVGWASCLY